MRIIFARTMSATQKIVRKTRNPLQLPSEVEEYRDSRWQRDEQNRVQTTLQAERFIERAGFAACMLDSRQTGPSLYIAVCGRRDAVLPRNVQKDPETSQTWYLKDDILRRGKVFYGKLSRGKATFVAPRMIPYWNALWGLQRRQERTLSTSARAILRVLRKEWEMGTADLRVESGVRDRRAFTVAIDELQSALLVVPTEVVYEPRFTYLWGLAEERFPEHLSQRIDRATALREVARCFLEGAGLTF
ncbi:MAG TPA: hypothetical protein VFR05_05885, partial [Terriglobia bacterium]|nr:hypothetical protein [Terriglobia bacterium]